MSVLLARKVCRIVSLLLAILTLTGSVLGEVPSKTGNTRAVQQGVRDDGRMLENYIEHEQSAEFDAFGADILQDFNLYSLECSMNVSALAHKYEVRLAHLLSYYRANKKAMLTKNFESLTNQTRLEVERNIRNTIQAVERERVTKVAQAEKTCQDKIKKHLEGKMMEIVNQGKHSLRSPSAFERLLTAVRLFQSRLYSHKRACEGRPGGSGEAGTVTCDHHSLQLLLNFTSSLISRLDYIRDLPYSDDEDLSSSRVGSGEDMDGSKEESSSSKHISTTAPIKLTKQSPDRETPSQTTPHQLESTLANPSRSNKAKKKRKPHTASQSRIVLEEFELVDTNNPGSGEDHYELDEATPIPDETTPIPDETTPILDETTPIPDETTIADETTPILDDTTVLVLDKTTQGQSEGIDIIIVEPKDPEVQRSHTSRGRHQMLVVLAILVTVVLVTSVAIVAVLVFLIVKKRQLQKSGYVKVQVSTETEATNETLEEIKKAGYVNPTYKFYTKC